MLYFKDLLNKLYIKFSKSKFVKWMFPVFLLILLPNVKASNLGSGVPLTYGNSTYAYNWASSSSWVGLSLYKSNGYDGGVYYTDTVSTGTNGISFGQFINGLLLKKHYYRITWAMGNGLDNSSCGTPASWANQLRFGSAMGNSSLVTRTYFNFIGIQNNITIFIDDPDATYNNTGCSYTIVVALDGNASFMNLPVNTTSSQNTYWTYYGYYIEDLGSTDSMTASDLNNAISNLQSSLNSSISSQTNAINGNIDDEFNKLKNQDHTYNNNANDTPSGQSDITSSNNKESQLMQSIDLDSSILDVTLNTDATTWIWNIVSNLRTINGKITLLFVTVLSLGIIKMILNR